MAAIRFEPQLAATSLQVTHEPTSNAADEGTHSNADQRVFKGPAEERAECAAAKYAGKSCGHWLSSIL